DSSRRPVPVGVAGELYIGGAGLARGYLRRPDITGERFVTHPFRSDESARLYRTGDLARYDADGRIEFLGRSDTQVKLRGFRIELGEIESVLAQHPAVRESVAAVREEPSGDQRLVTYAVPAHTPPPTARELRRFLLERIPDYMVPTTFVWLKALPRTPNGKV